MEPLFEVKKVDRFFYATRLEKFLPKRIIDIHTHSWRAQDVSYARVAKRDKRIVSWPARVAKDSPIEELLETYRLMLPGKQVTPLIFPTVPHGDDLSIQNRYVAK